MLALGLLSGEIIDHCVEIEPNAGDVWLLLEEAGNRRQPAFGRAVCLRRTGCCAAGKSFRYPEQQVQATIIENWFGRGQSLKKRFRLGQAIRFGRPNRDRSVSEHKIRELMARQGLSLYGIDLGSGGIDLLAIEQAFREVDLIVV